EVLVPAPSVPTLIPLLPAAIVVAPVMTDTASERLSAAGVADTAVVGNAATCVVCSTRCCALVALADCPIHARIIWIFKPGAATGMIITKLTGELLASVNPAPPTVNSLILFSLQLTLLKLVPETVNALRWILFHMI